MSCAVVQLNMTGTLSLFKQQSAAIYFTCVTRRERKLQKFFSSSFIYFFIYFVRLRVTTREFPTNFHENICFDVCKNFSHHFNFLVFLLCVTVLTVVCSGEICSCLLRWYVLCVAVRFVVVCYSANCCVKR